ncbi:hypothetical protein BH18THE2_BH18THE2_20220 [soil metagenome]
MPNVPRKKVLSKTIFNVNYRKSDCCCVSFHKQQINGNRQLFSLFRYLGHVKGLYAAALESKSFVSWQQKYAKILDYTCLVSILLVSLQPMPWDMLLLVLLHSLRSFVDTI